MQILNSRLQKRKLSGNFRELNVVAQSLIDFASNDYLGLAQSKQLFKNILKAWQQQSKIGSGGSRLLTGNTEHAESLEKKISDFHGFEAGLLFGTGYLANIGVLPAVAHINDLIFYDAEIHASMRDGLRLSKAGAHPFKHNDLNHLEKKLKQSSSKGNRYICLESIYSTDGSMAPLKEMCFIAKKYEAHLIVDEAHALGVRGSEGKGIVSELKLEKEIFAVIGTFGKGLGIYGAIVLGNQLLKDTLINFARSMIYTTALPFYNLVGIECSYALFPKLQKERKQIAKLIELFHCAGNTSSKTHIQSIKVQGNRQALALSKHLSRLGFDVRALLSPTVRRGHERLRICLHSFNTVEQVNTLLSSIQGET